MAICSYGYLQQNLVNDLDEYDKAARAALGRIDKEVESITDRDVQRNMQLLRRRALDDQKERENSANETITLLENVRSRGSDLQHAANIIMIAKDLHAQGETMDARIAEARNAATTYQNTTNTLFSKINTVLTAEK